MGRNLKILISIILIVLLGGVVTLYAYVDSNSTASNLESTAQQHMNHDEIIHAMINDLYYDENQNFLSEGLTNEQIDQVQAEIDVLNLSTPDKNQYLKKLEEVRLRLEVQKEVNNFFAGATEAIRGNTVTKDLDYRNNLDQEDVLEVKDNYYYELEIADEDSGTSESGQVNMTDETPIQLDEFQITINRFIDQAEEDLSVSQVLKNAFEDVKEIEIVDGNMGRIALAMNKFDQELLMIEDSHPELYTEMSSQAEKYSQLFLEEVSLIAESIPQYYEILLIAVEPSERLLQLLLDNNDLFMEENIKEESSQESVEIPVETPAYDFEYDYQDDYNDGYYFDDNQPPANQSPGDNDEETPAGETPLPDGSDNSDQSSNPQQDVVGPNP